MAPLSASGHTADAGDAGGPRSLPEAAAPLSTPISETRVEADGSLPFAHQPSHTPATATQSAHAHAIAQPATAPAIAAQLSVAVEQAENGQIELTLSPEELGRVKLSIQQADGGISVSLQAERPETLELMRRNIELLQRDFRALGYEQISFSFDQNGAGQGSGFRESPHSEPASASATIDAAPPSPPGRDLSPAYRREMPGGGLDIRI